MTVVMMSVRSSTDKLIPGMQDLDIIFSARRRFTYTVHVWGGGLEMKFARQNEALLFTNISQ